MRSSAEGFRMVKELCSNIQDLYKTVKQGRLQPNTPWAPSGPVRILPLSCASSRPNSAQVTVVY